MKEIVPFIGFMVLKTTGLSSRFKPKNQFWKKNALGAKILTKMYQNSGLQTFIFGNISANFSGPDAYFQHKFLRWICELKPVIVNFFLPYNGVPANLQAKIK